jgi:hypothetical protein
MANPAGCLTKKCPDCKGGWLPYGSPKFGVKCNLCGEEFELSWFTEMNDLGWPQKPVKMTELPKPECAERHVQDVRILCSVLGIPVTEGFPAALKKVRKILDEKHELVTEKEKLDTNRLPEPLRVAMKEWAMGEAFYTVEVSTRVEAEGRLNELEGEDPGVWSDY